MRKVGFIRDPSLVLYLPLYRADGSSFASRDARGHLCTATGTVWTPAGRKFDGVDDVIDVPYHAAYDVITEFTVVLWLRGTGVMAIGRDKLDTNKRLWKIGLWDNTFHFWVSGISAEALNAPSAYDTASWHYVAVAFKNATLRRLVADGALVASDIPSGNVKQDSTIGLRLGDRMDAGFEQFSGLQAEVWFYNRFLTFPEIQQNYLATKWRYR